MSMLDRKLWRDLIHIWGQVIAIGFVIAAGVAVVVLSLGTMTSLRETRDAYYDRYRFADVFAYAKRAPEQLSDRIADIPGVRRVDTRIVQDIILNMPDLLEPARGRIHSLPEGRQPELNRLFLRSGRLVEPGRPDEVILNVAFAEEHDLHPGDEIVANVNGRRRTLQVVGTVILPSTGALSINGLGNITPVDNFPALVSAGNLNLTLVGNLEAFSPDHLKKSRIYGLLYVQGNISLTGNNTTGEVLTGSLLGYNITLTGNPIFQLIYDPSLFSDPPPGIDFLELGQWREVFK